MTSEIHEKVNRDLASTAGKITAMLAEKLAPFVNIIRRHVDAEVIRVKHLEAIARWTGESVIEADRRLGPDPETVAAEARRTEAIAENVRAELLCGKAAHP